MAKKQQITYPHEIQVGAVVGTIYRSEHRSKKLASGEPRYVYTARTGSKRTGDEWKMTRHSHAKAEAELRLRLSQLNQGRLGAADMTLEDREELLLLRKLAGNTPPVVALREWLHDQQRREQAALGCTPIAIEDALDKFIREGESAGNQHERTYRSKLNSLLLTTVETPDPKDPRRTIVVRTSLKGRSIHSITRDEMHARLQTYHDVTTRNDVRKRAITLWKWAREAGHIPREMSLAPEQVKRAKDKPIRIVACHPTDYARLLLYISANHTHHLPALVLAGLCGVRVSEIHGKRKPKRKKGQRGEAVDVPRQTWEDIHLEPESPETPHLRVTNAKEGTPARRKVPLCPAAIAWLQTTPVGQRTGYVCEENALARIRAIGRARGLRLPKNSFRKSYISYRCELETDKAAIAKDAGTSVEKIETNYRELPPRRDALEWWRLTPEHCRANYTAPAQPTHEEISRKGGQQRSDKKIAAVTKSLDAINSSRDAEASRQDQQTGSG